MSVTPHPNIDRAATQLSPRDRVRGFVETFGPLLGLVLVIAFFGVADWIKEGRDSFLTHQNASTIAAQTATVAVAALGMTVIIIAGGIDLAAGTAIALSATVLATALVRGWSPLAAVAASIATGGLCGLINGVLISALRVVPFIVTLGTMTFYLGLAKQIANETTVRPSPDVVPSWMPALVSTNPKPEWLVVGWLPNFASGVWIALALALIVAAVLRYTVFGRYVFALGSNESTARLCGINVPLVKIAVYVFGGLFVGIAGVYQFGRLSIGNPTSGIGMELKIIAAVVIGGGSLTGGRGTVIGTLAGAAMMGVITSGCTLLDVKNPVQDMIIGGIIVAAVTLDQLRLRRLAA